MRTKSMVLCALCSALLCIFSLLTLPIGAVPLSLATFGVMTVSLILGWKKGLLSTGIYLLLGAIGLPVFAGFQSGIGILPGPTGGYLLAYLPMAVICGLAADKAAKKHFLPLSTLACMAATILCYLLGTWRYTAVTGAAWQAAFTVCCLPFLPLDAVKCLLAPPIALAVRRAVRRFS